MSNAETAKGKVAEAQARLFSARMALHPLRQDFIVLTSLFVFVPLTPQQKLLLFHTYFSEQYELEIKTVRKDIGPPKNSLGQKLTNPRVEEDVFKKAGDFSTVFLTNLLGEPVTEKRKKFYRQFGEATIQPHVVFTKVVQRQESNVKGVYGRDDDRGHIQMFTRLFKKRLKREEIERKISLKSLHSTSNTIK